jgi:FkbM family methyltransferase
MKGSVEFTLALRQEITRKAYEFHPNNTDYDRYNYSPPLAIKTRIRERIRATLSDILRYPNATVSTPEPIKDYKNRIAILDDYVDGLSDLYELLEDQDSRDRLVSLMAYRVLGKERVKLPLNTDSFWAKREYLKSLLNYDNSIKLDLNNWVLAYIDLKPIGYPIKLYSNALIIHSIFELKQYEYRKADLILKASAGDVVIDAGGCWGDTALYFANEVGLDGKVYTFEFIPRNLDILRKNLDFNSELKSQIEVVERPLWHESDVLLYSKDNGPASQVCLEKFPEADIETHTLTIDDFVIKNRVRQIDYIKMDIEGAEINVLRGATQVIKTFRPKLAISLYHSLIDFVTIPRFLSSLCSGYKFYLGHYTIHSEETVLFGIPKS